MKNLTRIFILFIYLFTSPCHVACGILVPWPGIKPMPPAVEVQSPKPLDHQGIPWIFNPWIFYNGLKIFYLILIFQQS